MIKTKPASEHQIQSAYIKLVDYHLKTYPQLNILFAVPNAAKRSMALASMLKAEGMRSGVPDVLLPFNNGKYNGLALEFKAGKNTLTDNQLNWFSQLSNYGWLCVEVRDAQGAWDITKDYILGK